jgi:hypothetical protein
MKWTYVFVPAGRNPDSHDTSCVKMPHESHILKWVFMYDTHVKKKEKILA